MALRRICESKVSARLFYVSNLKAQFQALLHYKQRQQHNDCRQDATNVAASTNLGTHQVLGMPSRH